jgi:LPXTG-motif cell wall-anchored protein
MRRFTALAAVFALLVLSLGHSVAFGQQPPAPVLRHQFRVEGAPLSGPYDLVNQTLHFAPGATTPWHTHPGQILVTVIEGELAFRARDHEKVYKTGESFAEMAGHVQQAGNTTSANTVLVVSYVLPDGAPLAVPEPGDTTPPPRPVPGWQFRTDALPPPTPYDVVHWVHDFAPGATTPWHTHAGQLLVTVLEGELTFNVNNADRVYKAGESFVELPNEVAQARNATGARTTVLATALLPKGAPLSHPVPAAAPAPAPVEAQPPALPEAGGPVPQPVALPDTGQHGPLMPVLTLAMMLLLGGAVLWRRSQVRR